VRDQHFRDEWPTPEVEPLRFVDRGCCLFLLVESAGFEIEGVRELALQLNERVFCYTNSGGPC